MELEKKEGFIFKAESIFSSIYGILLGPSNLPSHVQIAKQRRLTLYNNHSRQLGLKTLIYSEEETSTLVIRSKMVPKSVSSSSSSSSMSSLSSLSSSGSSTAKSSFSRSLAHSLSWPSVGLDDFLGTESGFHINSDEEDIFNGVDYSQCIYYNPKRNQKGKITKEYPPPIPILLSGSGSMPWILTRNYTDGKLVIREEKVVYYEYFEAHRENGRLVLNLVSFDDRFNLNCEPNLSERNEEEEDLQEKGIVNFTCNGDGDGDSNCNGNGDFEGYGGGGLKKCLSYTTCNPKPEITGDENDVSSFDEYSGSAPPEFPLHLLAAAVTV